MVQSVCEAIPQKGTGNRVITWVGLIIHDVMFGTSGILCKPASLGIEREGKHFRIPYGGKRVKQNSIPCQNYNLESGTAEHFFDWERGDIHGACPLGGPEACYPGKCFSRMWICL